MEKYGVIREDLTPPEKDKHSKRLEDHVTTRLSEKAAADMKKDSAREASKEARS